MIFYANIYINSLKFGMFSKIKSIFSKEDNPEAPSADFKHPNMNQSDASQCPFMKKNKDGQPGKSNQTKQKQNKNSDSQSEEEEEKPRGGCPFMASSGTKKNPNLCIQQQGYDEPYVSKFKYYLSANKLNFEAMRKGKNQNNSSRQVFNTYPIYVKHTLFYNGEDYQKVRSFECCSRFLAYQELRERGNKFFNKGKYAKALDFYERAMSLYRWLELKQKTHPLPCSQLSIEQIPSRSEISEEEQMGSKVHLNLQSPQEQKKMMEDRDKQLDQLTSKYKQFFIIYNDSNVEYHGGEQFTEKADIDMKNSLLIQIYLNMAAAYIKLNHFSLARQVIQDGFQLSDRVSQLYLRKAQSIVCDQSSTLSDIEEAQECIERAIQMRSGQKIFQNTNKNILKMINIHDAEEVYNQVLKKVEQRRNILQERYSQRKKKIQDRLAFINQTQKQIILEGKTPKQSAKNSLLSETSEFKILQRMHDKYIRVLEFYTEAKNKEQIGLAKNEFQQILRVLTEIKEIQEIKIQRNDDRLGQQSQKVCNRIKNIKRQHCEDIYNAAKYNFNVLEWAIKEIVNEEKQQEEERQKREKQERQLLQKDVESGDVQIGEVGLLKDGKKIFAQKLPYAMVIVPVIGFIINHYLF